VRKQRDARESVCQSMDSCISRQHAQSIRPTYAYRVHMLQRRTTSRHAALPAAGVIDMGS